MPEPAAAVAVRQRSRPQRPLPLRPAGPTRAPAGIPPAVGRLALGPNPGGGQPLPPSVAAPLSASLGVDVADVRVHTDASAATAAETLGARAFALGNRIFLGRRERPTDLALMAHEVAHVVQQRGGAMVQRWTSRGGDAHEREAHRASAAVVRGESFAVRERTAPRVQRLGLSDVLDYFADKANLIPGFRMFTIIIGVNPVNMSKVDRSAANILRAIVEFIPGGALVTQALDKYGVFEKVGGWVEEQIGKLGMTGSLFKKALDEFIDSLGWSDIFDLGDVWDRAKRIFTEPIRKLIDFAAGLITGILGFIKDAILRPLAVLAKGTPGYDLLKAVLGRDPITDEVVPQTADALIGGFMKLIGQEQVWENIKKANAIDRAWAWFKGALKELLAFVRGIPGRFVTALKSLELVDIVVLPNAFKKVVGVFAGIVGDFLGWGLKQVLSLLQIIFEALVPSVMPYVRKAMGAFKTIIANPVRFVGNLVRAGVTGFKQFAKNFLSHLRTALIKWLTGTLTGANIYIPQAFEIREIIKFVLSVLGLTWQNIRGKLVAAIGDTAVKVLEEGFDIVVTLVKEGPAAAWEKIKEQLANLKEMVMEQVMAFVREKIVEAAITKILTSLNPAGAFIQAILAIYNTVMFVVERLRQIGEVVASFIDSIAAIAAGAVGAAANRVEQTMAGALVLVVSFLARFAGLGKVSDMVLNVVKKIRAPIDKAIDKVIDWVVTMAKKLGKLVVGAARGAAQKVAGWLGLKREFRTGGKTHSLTFQGKAEKSDLVVASTPVHAGTWINTRRDELKAKNQYDSTKEAAYKAIQKDLVALGKLTHLPAGKPPSPTAEQDAAKLLDSIAVNAAVLGLAGDEVPVPRMVVTPGLGGHKAVDMTVQFLFKGPGNHPAGSPTTGRESLLGAWDELDKTGVSRKFWKSGHLLNVLFGGTAVNSNLVPLPTAINRQQADFDETLRGKLYATGKVLFMRFVVKRAHPQDPGKHFLTSLKIESGEMLPRGGVYEKPQSLPHRFERSDADLPYPALPTSALTLNMLIAAGDKSRKTVRDFAQVTQLENTLLADLIARGKPLKDVDDIAAFIESKRADYGDKRVANYLANFKRVKAGIKL